MSSAITTTYVPGTQPVGQAANKALIIGPSSAGVKDTQIYTFASQNKVNTDIGYGNAALAAQLFMAMAPSGYGSVDVLVASGSNTSITTVSAASPSITVAGTPYADYDLRIVVTDAGITGAMKFKYSGDGGNTYTDPIRSTGSLSGSYVLPNMGITVSFATGTHAEDNTAMFTVLGPTMSTAQLAQCMATVSNSNSSYTLVLVADSNPNPSSNLFTAMDGHLDTLQAQGKYTAAVVPGGGETRLFNRTFAGQNGTYNASTTVAAEQSLENSTGNFCALIAEKVNTYIPVTQPGYARPRLPLAFTVAAEMHGVGSDISKNPAQSAIRRVETPSYDEFKDGFVYSDEQIIAPRTFQGEPGIQIDEAWLKYAPTNADVDIWPKARVVNRATEVVRTALRPWLHARVRTLTDGTGRIDPGDKAVIETSVNKALRAALITPTNGQGFPGHCTAVLFTINGENNLLSTSQLEGTTLIVPFAYPNSISVNISLTDTIPVSVG